MAIRYETARKAPRLALAALLWLAACGAAHAQYIWVDAKGTKHYSDRPPEASVPANRILKAPNAPEAAAAPAPGGEPAGRDASGSGLSSAALASPGLATTSQKNADFQKRRLEQQEGEKKAGDEAKRKAGNAAGCERMRQYQKALTAGERIALPDKNGERSYLNEEQRTAELKENQTRLAECKDG